MLGELVKLGFERSMVVDSLRSRIGNKATVTYHLMVDNRRKLPSSGYLSAEMVEGAGASAGGGAGGNAAGRLPSSAMSSAAGGPAGAGGVSGASSSSGGLPQQRLVAERKWRLGSHVRGHPAALMAELYRCLAAHGIAWKKLAPYNLKCRTEITPSAAQVCVGVHVCVHVYFVLC